jgi:hypothetical protein
MDNDPIVRAEEDAADAHLRAAGAHERAREAHEDAASGHEDVADSEWAEDGPAEAAVEEEYAARQHERAAHQALGRGEQEEKAIARDPHSPDPPPRDS